ncbi:MAG: hypothetical protein KAH30_04075 [Caldisericia bacterium]|nr:hypothetical protein [Caldisericia bacterium]
MKNTTRFFISSVLCLILVLVPVIDSNHENNITKGLSFLGLGAGNANVSRNKLNNGSYTFALDDEGFIHIAWVNGSPENFDDNIVVRYTKWDGMNWVCVDGSVYEPTYSVENNPVVVSCLTRYSILPMLAVDNFGCPHLTWTEYDVSDQENPCLRIRYIKQDGDNWVCADDSIFDASDTSNDNPAIIIDSSFLSAYSTITIDNNNKPHLVWLSADMESENYPIGLVYTKWNGENWVCADDSIFDNSNLEIENPAIVCLDVERDEYTSSRIQLSLDSNNNPHLAWDEDRYKESYSDLTYIRWNGEDWVCADGSVFDSDDSSLANPANITKGLGGFISPSLDLDADNNPHLAWCGELGDNYTVMYTYWNGEDWVCADGSIYDSSNRKITNPANISKTEFAWFPCMQMDNKGFPHISWISPPSTDEEFLDIYNVSWNGENWICADGSSYDESDTSITSRSNVTRSRAVTFESTFVLDDENNPHYVWNEGNFSLSDYSFLGVYGDLYHINWNGENWVTASGEEYIPITNENSDTLY